MTEYDKKIILDTYNDLCRIANKKLTREEYRKLDTGYSSSLIEKIWGNWTNFIKEADDKLLVTRNIIVKKFKKNINKVIITYVNDGSFINEDFYNTLLTYCKYNGAELGILWGKSIKKKQTFDRDTFDLLQPYLATEFLFERDPSCLVQDFLIPSTQKNPLLNLDKLSTNIKTIVVGSNKQYLQILPYKQYTNYRIACSTGTLSIPDYKDTVAGHIDLKYHKFGAILLDWNEEQNRYIVRNITYNNNCLYDLDKKYTPKGFEKIKNLPGMVLGDLHLPDEDTDVIKKTKEFINKYKPIHTMLHDVASWNSVCHHNFGKCLFNAQNITNDNFSLASELECVVRKLFDLSNDCPDTKFKIVHSNHDAFIEKWLDTGEFIQDKINARLGAQLFVKYCDNKSILTDLLPKNVEYLSKDKEFNICGFIVSEHGDAGISGANGSPNAFNKTFDNCIVGHTHSCEIREKTFYVGTLSKLIVNYNQKGMTRWVHANAIIHENQTVQLILI